MNIIETRPREIGFVLWGHCQNLLDDPRRILNIQLRKECEKVYFNDFLGSIDVT